MSTYYSIYIKENVPDEDIQKIADEFPNAYGGSGIIIHAHHDWEDEDHGYENVCWITVAPGFGCLYDLAKANKTVAKKLKELGYTVLRREFDP